MNPYLAKRRKNAAEAIGRRIVRVAADANCIAKSRMIANIRGRTDRWASAARAQVAAVLEERDWSYPLIAAALKMKDHKSAMVAARRAKAYDVERLGEIADAELGPDWWMLP